MMRLLLDTHIWLWGQLEPHRVARRVQAELSSTVNELWLSPVSIWEALLLVRRGTVRVEGDAIPWMERFLRATPRREAPLTSEVAIESERIDLPHRDPADRLLAATARVYDLTLVTADDRLMHSAAFQVLPNR